MHYSGATVVGKGAEFVYVEPRDRTVRRRMGSELYSGVVAGGTMLLSRGDLEAVGGWRPMPRSVDRGLLDRVLNAGGLVYRTHGFGFVYTRHGDGHTWDPGVDYFLHDPRRAGPGFRRTTSSARDDPLRSRCAQRLVGLRVPELGRWRADAAGQCGDSGVQLPIEPRPDAGVPESPDLPGAAAGGGGRRRRLGAGRWSCRRYGPENTRLVRVARPFRRLGDRERLHVGASQSTGDVIQRLDADMVVFPAHVEAHARWHHRGSYAVTLGDKRFVDVTTGSAGWPTPDAVTQAAESDGVDCLFDVDRQ